MVYEALFKRPSVLARYREGAHSDARREFLVACAAEGYSDSMLRKIAWVLLAVANGIDIERGGVTARDIEQAVDGRRRFKRLTISTRTSEDSRRLFIHIATEWVRNAGCLAQSPEVKRPFDAQIAAYAQHLGEERGLSPVTVSTGCERLGWFFQSLGPSHDRLCTISIGDVDKFIDAQGNKGWRRSSLASLASSLRSFFRYAEGQGWCTSGIAAAIESPRLYAEEGLPLGPDWEVVQRLLRCTRGDHPADIRDHAILLLLAAYGLRRSEVAALRLDDLDWDGERIAVSRPKQRRTQWYPLIEALGEAILRYLREIRPRCTHRSLFLTLNAPIRPLSASSITAVARARLRALGVIASSHGAHSLRHACARHLLAEGFSLKQIGDHLGHRATNSTLHYAKVDLAGLREVADLDLGGLR